MNILFLSHQAAFIYGGEICTLELMQKLKEKHKISFCSPPGPYHERAKAIVKTYLISSIEFRRHFLILPKFVRSWIKTRKELRKIIFENEINILHATSLKSFVYTWKLGKKTNLRILWHHYDIMPRKSFNRYWLKFLATGCHRIVVPSKATKEALLEVGIEDQKVSVIYNGIDISHWPVRGEARHRTKLKIVLLGELSHRKGTDIVAPLIGKLEKKIPFKFEFTIIGEALSEPDFAADIRQANQPWCDSGYIRFLGRREDIKELLVDQDLMIVPSRQDPFPTVIIEATLSSLPVLASPVGGIPEMLLEEKTGYLCSDIEQYVDRIVALEANRETLASMSKSARAFGEQRFSSAVMVNQLSELYFDITRIVETSSIKSEY